MSSDQPDSLPVKGDLRYIYASSLLIAMLSALGAALAILFRGHFYPAEELAQAFIPNDVVILAIGLPMLLGSLWSTRRGSLLGLLFWPGALFFGLYNSIAYVFALPLTWGFLIHLCLAVLGVYTLIGLVARIDGETVQARLAGSIPEKICGGVIASFGILFILRVLYVLINALIAGSVILETEFAVNVPDAFISPALIMGGIALWKRKALGYVSGLGLLFQTSMLFAGLIVFLLLQPILTTAPFVLTDVLVILVMGLVCSIPLALFIRGVKSARVV